MSKRPPIKWGPIDANDDDDLIFQQNFIKTKSFENVLNGQHPIISGEKGTGKSAFRRYIVDAYQSNGLAVSEISFDDLEFASIIAGLNSLVAYTNSQPLSMLSQYWKYILITSAMKSCMKKNSLNLSKNSTIIREYLIDTGIMEMGVVSIMYHLTVEALRKIDSLTDPKLRDEIARLGLPSALHPQVYESFSKYPLFDPKFIKARDAFKKYLAEDETRILVTLDGFDNIKANSSDSREKIQIIFDSLITACYQLSIEKEFKKFILINCYVPHDRFIAADLRDFDKIQYKQTNISWTYGDLKKLVERKIQVSIGKPVKLEDTWGILFPEIIKNACYSIEENSLDYVIRHTLYRPRQLLKTLEELEKIAEEGDLSDRKFRETVAKLTNDNTAAYFKEYAIDHPKLRSFCGRLKNYPNVVKYSDFRSLVHKALSDFSVEIDVDKKIDQLYNMGFFGKIRQIESFNSKDLGNERYFPPPLKSGVRYECKFYYISPDASVSHNLQGEDLICIHPMLFDYCEQKPDPEYLIG